MSDINDHVQLNPGVGGATIATDVVDGAHYQYVKIAHGISGEASTGLAGRTRPLPVTIEQLNNAYSNKYVAVAGSTDGTDPVTIAGDISVSVGTVGISGGTIQSIVDGVSADIRSVASDVKIGVHTISPDVLAVTGDVAVSNQVNVNIASVDLPSTAFTGAAPGSDGGAINLGFDDLKTGVRIKNLGPEGQVSVGAYALDPGENIFIEINNLSNVPVVTAPSSTYVCWIAT
jgi:hypothetical protein